VPIRESAGGQERPMGAGTHGRKDGRV
jgi:hypothetical protein